MKMDEDGPINIEVLDNHWKEPRKCNICGTELEISNMIYELPEFWPRHPSIQSARIPIVALFCKECGNTILFNAIILKVIDEGGNWLLRKESRAGGE